MSYSMEPLNFLAGRETLGSLDPEWNLDEYVPGGAERSYRVKVDFSRRFRAAPLVQIGIAGFDMCNKDAARLTTAVDNVTNQGFEIVLSTWLHSRLWRVEVNWLAIGT